MPHIPRYILTINIQSYRKFQGSSVCLLNPLSVLQHACLTHALVCNDVAELWTTLPTDKNCIPLHMWNTKISFEQRMINMLNHTQFLLRLSFLAGLYINSRIIPDSIFIRLPLQIKLVFLYVYIFKSRINISNLMSLICKLLTACVNNSQSRPHYGAKGCT